MNHFDEMTCLLYLDGQLEVAHARELSAHAGECAECRALLGALERESRWLRDALTEEDESVPARLLDPRQAHPGPPWGWIAALGFGAAGLYSLWAGLIEPMRQQLSLAGFTEGNLLTILLFHGTLWKGWQIMRSLIEFLAVSSLGIALLALLRRNWRRWTTVVVVLVGLASALMLPPSAAAAEVKKGDPNYTLASGEVVKNDLIFFGKTAHIDGEVDGDVIATGDRLEISGHVKGDVIGCVQVLRITGTVDGNIRAGAESIYLSGTVGKNVTLWTGNLETSSTSRINGSAIIGGGDLELSGKLDRDLIAFGSELTLNGLNGGNVLVRAGRLMIGSSAVIQGSARYKGTHKPEVSPGAKLASPLSVEIVSHLPNYADWHFYWHQFLFYGVGFVYGLALLLLWPGFFADSVRSAGRYGVSFGFGLLLVFATPILAIVACLTIFGLAVGIATLLLYVLAIFATTTIVGSWLGEKILGPGAGTGPAIARLALGLFILRVARKLPYVGGWILFVVVIWGLGALAVAAYRRRQTQAVAV